MPAYRRVDIREADRLMVINLKKKIGVTHDREETPSTAAARTTTYKTVDSFRLALRPEIRAVDCSQIKNRDGNEVVSKQELKARKKKCFRRAPKKNSKFGYSPHLFHRHCWKERREGVTVHLFFLLLLSLA